MKKNIGRISLIALLFLVLACGTGWGYTFTDPDGHYWTANGTLTIECSDISGFFNDAADGSIDGNYSLPFSGNYNSGSAEVKGKVFENGGTSFSLDANGNASVSGDTNSWWGIIPTGGSFDLGTNGGKVYYDFSVTAISGFSVTTDLALMFFQGDPDSTYVYAGLEISGLSLGYSDFYNNGQGFDLASILCNSCSNSFDINGSVNLIAGQECGDSPVPIPGAAWLLGSGLLGLVSVRRRRKEDDV